MEQTSIIVFTAPRPTASGESIIIKTSSTILSTHSYHGSSVVQQWQPRQLVHDICLYSRSAIQALLPKALHVAFSMLSTNRHLRSISLRHWYVKMLLTRKSMLAFRCQKVISHDFNSQTILEALQTLTFQTHSLSVLPAVMAFGVFRVRGPLHIH